MKKIFYSRYELHPNQALNSRASVHPRKGVLVKVVDGDSWGVADLFTWPEFGDETYEEAIQDKSTLYLRCLELAEKDLLARKEKRSLLKDQFVDNNLLVLDFKKEDFNLEKFHNQTVKIKGNDQFLDLAKTLNQVKISNIRFRIDFNSILAVDEFDEFLEMLSSETLAKIEYVEDPTVWNSEDWERWDQKIPLALDWSMTDYLAYPNTWSVLVVKPTRQSLESLLKPVLNLNKKITLTSAMEHPVGLMHGVAYAQELNDGSKQGFLTINNYQETSFQKYFAVQGSQIKPSELALADHGIGMTEELNKLSWSESI